MLKKNSVPNKFKFNYNNLFLFFLIFFPLSFIAGNLFINISLLLLFVLFIFNFRNNKINLKDPIILLFLFLIFTLFVNLIFSINQENSIPRVLKFFLYFVLIIELKKLIIENQNLFEKKILKYWSWIFLVVLFDVIFEIYFGKNILGFKSYYPGRIASFFNDELVVGSFFLTFSLISLSFMLQSKDYSKLLILLYIIILITLSFLIGERSNFIKFFISILIFTLIVIKPKIKQLFAVIFISIIILITLTQYKSSYLSRYYQALSPIFVEKNLNKYLKNSQYGAHYDGAYQIFKSYPLFGVGIKNFRNEVFKEKYKSEDYSLTNQRWATHPHQVHYELLSETGLFGYLSFMFFIILSIFISVKNYLLHKNNFQLSAIIIVSVSMIPLLPSGSIYSTFAGGLFWLNYAIMVAYNKKLN